MVGGASLADAKKPDRRAIGLSVLSGAANLRAEGFSG